MSGYAHLNGGKSQIKKKLVLKIGLDFRHFLYYNSTYSPYLGSYLGTYQKSKLNSDQVTADFSNKLMFELTSNSGKAKS